MKLFHPFLYFLLFTCTHLLYAQTPFELKWDQVATLPVQENGDKSVGFAGMFAGVHNGVIILAGGANFPNAVPWEGGEKRWWDEIYVLQSNGNGFEWNEKVKAHLPENLGYGAAVSTPEGVLIIGGENSSGPKKSVYLLTWNPAIQEVEITKYPDLPIPLSHSSAAVIGSKVYLAGGESLQTSGDFWVLEMDDSSGSWEQIPSWPGSARSNAVLIAQRNGSEEKLYLIGGRKKTDSGVSDLFSDLFVYDPCRKIWAKEGHMLDSDGQPLKLSAFSAISVDSTQILVFGGVTGKNFSWLEETASKLANPHLDSLQRIELVEKRNKLLNNHPGFSKDVLAYHTVTKRWFTIDQFEFDSPVNTMAIAYNGAIFLPSGEIFPGIRSPYIQRLTIVNHQSFEVSNYLLLIGVVSVLIGIGILIYKKKSNSKFTSGRRKI